MDHDWKIKNSYIDLLHGDCIKRLRRMDDECVDSVVTDPPYEINLLNKKWDSSGIAHSVELWEECLRVLKPGGHLIAFSSTRTYHRMVCAIEDAGFEIKDQLAWMFGQSMPRSQNIGKAIDDLLGMKRKVIGYKTANFGKSKSYGVLKFKDRAENLLEITEPASELAIKWNGWGTGLKTGYEPICLARKPISEKTIVLNILKWGTGALNIDATRIRPSNVPIGNNRKAEKSILPEGRWPANICHDGSDDIVKMFPNVSAMQPVTITREEYINGKRPDAKFKTTISESAARMYYVPKSSIFDKDSPKHSTVKAVNLMRWLTRLVTPPNGIVLDPFAGSGSTGIAALIEGFDCVLIEKEDEYINIIAKRFQDLIRKYGKRNLF